MPDPIPEIILKIMSDNDALAVAIQPANHPPLEFPLHLDLEELAVIGHPDEYARTLSAALQDCGLGTALEVSGGGRLRLDITTSAWRLHELRWECLQREAGGVQVPLSAHPASPFSRLAPHPDRVHAPQTGWPLRVLVAISSPNDLEAWRLAPLDIAQERAEIERAFKPLQGLVEVSFLERPVSLDRVMQALEAGPHIFHFLGHGVYNSQQKTGALLLENESDGSTQLVKDATWQQRLGLLESTPHLVTLAACESSSRVNGAALVGIAPNFLQAGSGAVIAMRAKVGIEVAREFMYQFYFHLATHGVIDQAANQARAYLLDWGGWSWSIPTLFLGRGSEQIFTAPPAALEVEPAGPGEILVLIPEFKGHEEADFEIELHQQLQERIEELKLDNVRVAWLRETILGPGDDEIVYRLAARYGASLVIWGYYYRAAFQANFSLTHQFAGLSRPKEFYQQERFRKALIAENDFSLLINFELPRQVEYLVFFTLAQLYYWEGDYDQAWQAFDQALRSAGDDEIEGLAQAYFYRGNLNAFHRQDRPATITDYSRALELAPGLAHAAFNLGEAQRVWANELEAHGQSDAGAAARQAAIQAFDRALALEPNFGLAYEQRAQMHFMTRAYKAAIDDYQAALRRRPRPETFNQLGLAWAHLHQYEAAENALDEAILRAPGTPGYYFNRGRVRNARQDKAGAAADLQTYLQLAGDNHPERQQAVRQWLAAHETT